jgi:hypothetical protein
MHTAWIAAIAVLVTFLWCENRMCSRAHDLPHPASPRLGPHAPVAASRCTGAAPPWLVHLSLAPTHSLGAPQVETDSVPPR